MPQIVMSRREFAGIPVTMTTVSALTESGQQRRLVALGWLSRKGGQVTISEQLTSATVVPAGR